MSALYATVLALCVSLSPHSQPLSRHAALTAAIVEVLEDASPLFASDLDRHRSAALMVAVAFRESSLDNKQVGDHGRSFCAFQIHTSSGGTAALLDDPVACARKAYSMIKESIRVDRVHPLAFYARGPRYQSQEAQRISNDRMALAKRLWERPAINRELPGE